MADISPKKPWYKSKTVWASIALALTALAAYFNGNTDLYQLIEQILIASGLTFLRFGQLVKLE
jgi:hypothetical protein